MLPTWTTLICILFMGARLSAPTPLAKKDLIGAWDYTTCTALKKGKQVGTANFRPHTMVFTYGDDGAWRMEAADATHTQLNGSFELRGNDLVLKKTDGSMYQDWIIEIRDGGTTLTLQDQHSAITASKISQ